MSYRIDAGRAGGAVACVPATGVVDENVQPAVFGFNGSCRGPDGCIVFQVNMDETSGHTFVVEYRDCRITRSGITRTDEHVHAGLSQLPRNLEADAFIGACDKRDTGGGGLHCVKPLIPYDWTNFLLRVVYEEFFMF
jgi:hypothetical protein